jgi:phosphoribosyl-AMP cyclohydrolase
MINKLDFRKGNGLIPTIIQNGKTQKILMLGYMNEQAYVKSIESGYVYFWSRSRNDLWLKGKQSGNKLKIIDIKPDCDKDTLLITVDYPGNRICHLDKETCFD